MENDAAQDAVLAGRIVICENPSDSFRKNIQMRYESCCEFYGIEDKVIKLVFCNTINKHTCMTILAQNADIRYLVFDEHHMQMLGSLNSLYYLYGQHDFKIPFYNIILNDDSTIFKEAMSRTLAILLAEKSLLSGNATRAAKYLSFCTQSNHSPESDCMQYEFDHNLWLQKRIRAVSAQGYAYNFYVFHEMAHVKFSYDPASREKYEQYLSQTWNSIKKKPHNEARVSQFFNTHPTQPDPEDYACDVLALQSLFDFIQSKTGDYQVEQMTEAYVISIINLCIMDSIIEHDTNFSDWYVVCWIRIILVVNALMLIYGRTSAKLEQTLKNTLELVFNKFNYFNSYVNETWEALCSKNSDIGERYASGSKEGLEEKESVLQTIANIN